MSNGYTTTDEIGDVIAACLDVDNQYRIVERVQGGSVDEWDHVSEVITEDRSNLVIMTGNGHTSRVSIVREG